MRCLRDGVTALCSSCRPVKEARDDTGEWLPAEANVQKNVAHIDTTHHSAVH